MRDVWAICAAFLMVCLVSGVALSTEEVVVDSTSSPGLVYGYGAKLGPPYEFTVSEDSKTLYLNGLIYDGPGDTRPSEVTVSEEMRVRHELSEKAHMQSELGATYDERLAHLAAAYISSPLVKSVRKDSVTIYVRWASNPDIEQGVMLRREEQKLDFDVVAFREELIDRFWQIVNAGGMVAFGKDYHVLVPAACVPKTIEQIERIRRGEPPERLDVVNTALQNRRFLGDLYGRREPASQE